MYNLLAVEEVLAQHERRVRDSLARKPAQDARRSARLQRRVERLTRRAERAAVSARLVPSRVG